MFKQILSALFGDTSAERTHRTGSPANESARPVQTTCEGQRRIARRDRPEFDEAPRHFGTSEGDASTTLSDISRYLGLLGVLGESEYQSARSAARNASLQETPVFKARLIPDVANRRDSPAVDVVLDRFGQIGYVPLEWVNGYGKHITVERAVRCPVQLRGTAPVITAIVDLARSEGARLTAWRPGDQYDYDAHAHFHAMRGPVLETVERTRTIEQSDLETAIRRYRGALQGVREYERFAVEHRLFTLTRPGTNARSVEVLDRLTACLVRAARHREAVEEADRYFAEFTPDSESAQVQAIGARLAAVWAAGRL